MGEPSPGAVIREPIQKSKVAVRKNESPAARFWNRVSPPDSGEEGVTLLFCQKLILPENWTLLAALSTLSLMRPKIDEVKVAVGAENEGVFVRGLHRHLR